MIFTTGLLDRFRKNKKELNLAKSCPNCWGRQEYEGKFYDSIKNNNLSITDKPSNLGWIQDYTEKNITGNPLDKNSETYVCAPCKVAYQVAS